MKPETVNQILIFKGRTMVVPVAIGYDVSSDVITSQIRKESNRESDLIAEWSVSFATDGTDGELVLTLDDAVTTAIAVSKGYMDLKRITNGEPVNVFDEPLEVLIKDPVTA